MSPEDLVKRWRAEGAKLQTWDPDELRDGIQRALVHREGRTMRNLALELEYSLREVETPSPERPADQYRIALRDDDAGFLDDVVVNGVSCFRMERMAHNQWWIACYLEGSDERIDWWANAHRKHGLIIDTTDVPADSPAFPREGGPWAKPRPVAAPLRPVPEETE